MARLMYIVIIVAFLDTFVQLPIITPYSLELGASYALTGIIVAIYSLTNIIGNIIGGHWIDQFGRKRMLLTGIVTVCISLLFYPLAQNGIHLLLARLIHGFAGGILVPAAFAYVGDRTEAKGRGKTMAWTGASIGTSAIVGPAIGGVIAAKASIETVFYLVAFLFFIITLIVFFFVKEVHVVAEKEAFQLKDFVPLLKHPTILFASLASFTLMYSNGTLAFALPLNVEAMGKSTDTTGILLSTFGIVALIIFMTPLNNMYDRFASRHLINVGLALLGVGMLTLSFFTTFITNFIAMVIYGIGFAFVFPSMNKLVADTSSQQDRGKAYGIFYAFFSAGVICGSSISGNVAHIAGMAFLVSAFVMFFSTIVLALFIKNKNAKQG